MSSSRVFTCHRQLHPSTGAEHSVYGHFTSSFTRNLIVARATELDIYTIHIPEEEGLLYNNNNNKDENIVCELIASFTLFATIETLNIVHVGKGIPDCILLSFKDAKASLMSFLPDSNELHTMAMWNFEEDGMGPGSGANAEKLGFTKFSGINSHPLTVVDIKGDCAIMLVYGIHLAAISLNRKHELFNNMLEASEMETILYEEDNHNHNHNHNNYEKEKEKEKENNNNNNNHRRSNSSVSNSNDNDVAKEILEAKELNDNIIKQQQQQQQQQFRNKKKNHHKFGVNNTGMLDTTTGHNKALLLNIMDILVTGSLKDMCMLDGYMGPTVALLYEPYQTNAGRLAAGGSTCSIIAVSINVVLRRYCIIWQVDSLPYDCTKIIAVPKPLGGLILVSTNAVMYIDETVKSTLAVNGFATETVNTEKYELDVMDPPLSVELAAPRCEFIQPNRMLLTTFSGELFALRIIKYIGLNCNLTVHLNLTKVGEGAYATTLQTIPLKDSANLLFMGSRLMNSLLIKIDLTASVRGNMFTPNIIKDEQFQGEEETSHKRQRLMNGISIDDDDDDDDDDEEEENLYQIINTNGDIEMNNDKNDLENKIIENPTEHQISSWKLDDYEFTVVDSFPTLGPLADANFQLRVPSSNYLENNMDEQAWKENDNLELICTSGYDKKGGVTILRNGIVGDIVTKIEIPERCLTCHDIKTTNDSNVYCLPTSNGGALIDISSRTGKITSVASETFGLFTDVQILEYGKLFENSDDIGVQINTIGIKLIANSRVVQEINFYDALNANGLGCESDISITTTCIKCGYVFICFSNGSYRLLKYVEENEKLVNIDLSLESDPFFNGEGTQFFAHAACIFQASNTYFDDAISSTSPLEQKQSKSRISSPIPQTTKVELQKPRKKIIKKKIVKKKKVVKKKKAVETKKKRSVSNVSTSSNYSKSTVPVLKKLCTERGIALPSKVKKADIVQLLENADSADNKEDDNMDVEEEQADEQEEEEEIEVEEEVEVEVEEDAPAEITNINIDTNTQANVIERDSEDVEENALHTIDDEDILLYNKPLLHPKNAEAFKDKGDSTQEKINQFTKHTYIIIYSETGFSIFLLSNLKRVFSTVNSNAGVKIIRNQQHQADILSENAVENNMKSSFKCRELKVEWIGPTNGLKLHLWRLSIAMLLETGDLFVYVARPSIELMNGHILPLSFVRVPHDVITRPLRGCMINEEEQQESKYRYNRIFSFENIAGRRGIFVGGYRPVWIICERGLVSVVPLNLKDNIDVTNMVEESQEITNLGKPHNLIVSGFKQVGDAFSNQYMLLYTDYQIYRSFLCLVSGDFGGTLGCVVTGNGNAAMTAKKHELGVTIHKIVPLSSSIESKDILKKILRIPHYIMIVSTPFEIEYEVERTGGNHSDDEDEIVAPGPAGEQENDKYGDPEAKPYTRRPEPAKDYVIPDEEFGGKPKIYKEDFKIRLMTSDGWKLIQQEILRENERVLACCTVAFDFVVTGETEEEKLKRIESRKTTDDKKKTLCVAVGTGVVEDKGEDAAGRGRIILYEIDYAHYQTADGKSNMVPKMRLACEREQKGAVSAIAQLGNHMIITEGLQILVCDYDGDRLCTIAFFYAQIFVMDINVVKNFVLASDALCSVQLLLWREEDHSLNILAKDYEDCEVYASEFIIDAPALGFIVCDVDRNIKVMQYDRRDLSSRGGNKLLCRADYHLGSQVGFLKRRKVTDLSGFNTVHRNQRANDRFALYFGTLDGGAGTLVPVDERVFRRLYALQGVMVNGIKHAAALNPRGFRLFQYQGFRDIGRKKNVLDGVLLWMYITLDTRHQKELAAAIGSTLDTILNNLLEIDLLTQVL